MDHVKDGILQIRFVKTKDNVADIFTKNVSEKNHVEHINKLMGSIHSM